MNIFYLHEDPRQCAEWMVNRHVVKMILETAHLLSTAHRVLDGKETIVEGWVDEFGIRHRKKKLYTLDDYRDSILYRASHINHPSAIWTRSSVENYNWLVDHLFALSDEYTYRYNKRHVTMAKMGYEIQSPPHNLKEWDRTPMPSCMDDVYKISDDPIINYRNYYRYGKDTSLHKWKKRDRPEWMGPIAA